MKQNSFILAAGVSLAMALTFSCSSDGSDGKDGAQGLQGEPGANGAGCIVSSVDEGTKITCGTSTVIIPNAANGTNGTDGIDGANGIDGESCEAEQGNDGVITITCGESKVGIAFCGSNEYNFYNPLTQTCQGGFVKYTEEALLKDTRDGKTYRYAEIGDYTWMAENLVYGNEEGEYTWAEAVEACPDGWELPSRVVVEDNEAEIVDILSNGSNDDRWWTSSEYSAGLAFWYGYNLGNNLTSKDNSYFVRCVKAN